MDAAAEHRAEEHDRGRREQQVGGDHLVRLRGRGRGRVRGRVRLRLRGRVRVRVGVRVGVRVRVRVRVRVGGDHHGAEQVPRALGARGERAHRLRALGVAQQVLVAHEAAGHVRLAVGGPALVRQQLLQRAHVRLVRVRVRDRVTVNNPNPNPKP